MTETQEYAQKYYQLSSDEAVPEDGGAEEEDMMSEGES